MKDDMRDTYLAACEKLVAQSGACHGIRCLSCPFCSDDRCDDEVIERKARIYIKEHKPIMEKIIDEDAEDLIKSIRMTDSVLDSGKEKQINDKKESKNMLKWMNVEKIFGKIGMVDEIRYTITGKLAFPDKNGDYLSYENGGLVNNMELTVDIKGAIAMPVQKDTIKEGDLVIINGKYLFADRKGYFISSSGAKTKIANVKNIIFGNNNFITKVTGLLDMQNMNPMMLMLLNNKDEEDEEDNKNLQNMLLMQMCQGNNQANMNGFNPMMLMAMSGKSNMSNMLLMQMMCQNGFNMNNPTKE